MNLGVVQHSAMQNNGSRAYQLTLNELSRDSFVHWLLLVSLPLILFFSGFTHRNQYNQDNEDRHVESSKLFSYKCSFQNSEKTLKLVVDRTSSKLIQQVWRSVENL